MKRSMFGIVLVSILAIGGVGPAQASSVAAPWTCRWVPTMDYNWHNDGLCSNGVRQVRPHLRPGDSHITQDELMSSARAWARARNGGR